MVKTGFTMNARVRFRTLAIFMAALLAIMSLLPETAYADEDWAGWTEDAVEDAWTVYVVTSWSNVQSLNFAVSNSGSIASASVPDAFRTQYQPIVEKILSNCSYSLQFKSSTNPRDKTQYTELILAMGYTLSVKGSEIFLGQPASSFDVIYLANMVDNSLAPTFTSTEDCFRELIRRYYLAERYYLLYNPEEGANYSLYSSDEYLQAVIQATIYGTGYTQENSEYSIDSAAAYFTNNTDNLTEQGTRQYDNYAAQVVSNYTAIRSVTEEYVVG